MSEKLLTVDFGAPDKFGVHLFRVEISAGRTESVTIVEDYGYRGQEGGIPRDEIRVVLSRAVWSGIADIARREFNDRLKAAKVLTGRWHTGTNLVDRLLGKELCVLAWAAETANDEQIPVICSKWAALRPEERWWLFAMTVAEAGMPEDAQRGWRRALFCALSDGQKPAPGRKRRRPVDTDLFHLPLLEDSRMSSGVTPFSLKDAPALIERLLPVQKLSAEAYKEQMAVQGKTLTALGSYWKGRKPLILNKASILGCLLPATDNPTRDLEIFEKLMAMDEESFAARQKRRPKPKELLAALSIDRVGDYFVAEPPGVLPPSSPVDWSKPEYKKVKIAWRKDIAEPERRRLEAQLLPKVTYRERVDLAQRPEEVGDTVHDHIWDAVNNHLRTNARSFPQLVEQLGIMRYGHRPRVADTFCGSGQIPFEAARLGCDVYASDLSPVACMLTWGAFNIVGGSSESREQLARDQEVLVSKVQAEIGQLNVETDCKGWRAKVFLYCVEVRCPQTGWMVPLLPTLRVSKGGNVMVQLVPDTAHKRYGIEVRTGSTARDFTAAAQGTVRTDGRGQDPYLIHSVDGKEHRTKISTLRGDYRKGDGTSGNRLRLWAKDDFKPRADDIFQERLYCIQWMRQKKKRKGDDYEFRTVTPDDLRRERTVEEFIDQHLADWQDKGWVPDMRIEPGDKTDEPIRTRGWTHWHHLFNPRQLLGVNAIRS